MHRQNDSKIERWKETVYNNSLQSSSINDHKTFVFNMMQKLPHQSPQKAVLYERVSVPPVGLFLIGNIGVDEFQNTCFHHHR